MLDKLKYIIQIYRRKIAFCFFVSFTPILDLVSEKLFTVWQDEEGRRAVNSPGSGIESRSAVTRTKALYHSATWFFQWRSKDYKKVLCHILILRSHGWFK